jgi:ribonuclease HI
MDAAWGFAKKWSIRPVKENLFILQVSCLGDWTRALLEGPWIFRQMGVMIEPYDGLVDPEVTEHMCNSEEGGARLWLANLIETLPQEVQTRVVVTLWAIWHACQKEIHEQQFQSPLSTHLFAERFIQDLRAGELRAQRCFAPPARGAAHTWIPPPQGMIKINVDATMGKGTGSGSVAEIARSESGEFMGASAVVLNGKTDPETLEAMACREAVALPCDINARRVHVASDGLAVVSSIKAGRMGVYAQVISEIKMAMEVFDHMSFGHEKRASNKEAHCLARSVVR